MLSKMFSARQDLYLVYLDRHEVTAKDDIMAKLSVEPGPGSSRAIVAAAAAAAAAAGFGFSGFALWRPSLWVLMPPSSIESLTSWKSSVSKAD